ncbi:PA domain-containing protein [Mucilaginibacter frigoritolerans]|uniref:PA domain-containing protein n=1 Tax=Mucilaginibacter frigoritolerans TaxID=652788 RepID=A0A562U7U4_9SPHI|nr:M28 family peptidase [Mucilaginibacter frigoritolerans]TWJ01427.1 PA domain-containing protein [Mucilaginibacter frigoritolerans]
MGKFYKLFSTVFLASAVHLAFAQQIKLSKDVEHALTLVDTAQIKADITYLADDKLKGRAPGTKGFQMAVDYVIEQLKALDVKPAGENNTWLQQVKLRKAFTKDVVLTLTGQPDLKAGADYIIYPNPELPKIRLNASLAFAGYGISEPSLGYDDYDGLDVKGKIVLVMRGAPDKFSSSVAAHTMNTTQILKVAAEHGAVGVIMASTDSTSRLPNTSRGIFSVMDKDGSVAVSRIYYSKQVGIFGAIGYKLFNLLLLNNGKSIPSISAQLKTGQPASFSLPVSADVSYSSFYQDIISYNVVGKIEGSDSELKKTYIVHSAHLDHLGIGTPVKGDSIYNGAHDNASGVASVLSIAKIYQNIKVKPKRSMLLVLLTGEELGDLGSGYFAKHPTVPAGSMVADVNTDMPTIIAPLLSITALGAEHSSMMNQVNEAAGYLGLSVEPDPEPKQARFTRSDQYSFVLQGIPAIHVKYGSKTADGKNNLNDMVAVWRAKYYHKPQDDINGIFDFGAGKKYAQLNFLIGYLIAQDPQKPVWNTGDIFEVK